MVCNISIVFFVFTEDSFPPLPQTVFFVIVIQFLITESFTDVSLIGFTRYILPYYQYHHHHQQQQQQQQHQHRPSAVLVKPLKEQPKIYTTCMIVITGKKYTICKQNIKYSFTIPFLTLPMTTS